MEELKRFEDRRGDEDAQGDLPGGGFSGEKEHNQTPENLIQNAAEGIIDPVAAGAGVEFGGEAEGGEEEEGGQDAQSWADILMENPILRKISLQLRLQFLPNLPVDSSFHQES